MKPTPVAKEKPLNTKPLMDTLFKPALDEYPEAMRGHVARMRVKMRRRHAISVALSVLSYMAIFCVLIFSALFIALATDRTTPVQARISIITPEVRPGGKLRMSVLIDRKRICQSKIVFRIFDGDGTLKSTVEMPWMDAAGPIGIDTPFIRELKIPEDATPGPSRLRIERAYRCPINPFHKQWPITDVDPDKAFDIVATTPGGPVHNLR